MGHSRVPTPISRQVSPLSAVSAGYSYPPTPGFLEARAASVLASLRLQIEAGATESSAILGNIAKEAQTLTEASGAAIALGQDDSVVCVGRSGETAPELGVHLSVDSGLSGECLRSHKTLRCDDTQMDMRVDAEVCLRLGLRSIVAVPLQSDFGQIGIVEAFSVYPFAFSDAHVKALEGLAKLVELAQERQRAAPPEAEPAAGLASFEPVRTRLSVLEQTGMERLRRILATHEKPSRRLAGLALSAAVLISAVAWRTLHHPAAAAQPVQAAVSEESAPAQTSPANVPSVTLDFSTKPSPITVAIGGGSRHRTRKAAADTGNDNADDNTDDVVVRNLSSSPQAPEQPTAAPSDAPSPSAAVKAAADQDPAPVEPPQISGLRDRTPDLQKLLRATAEPKFAPVVSQITRGALQHRVEPAFPEQARSLGLFGPVVLEASIDENGAVEDVKVISGHPVLARAAIEAVRQWRYSPSLLNGKPVKVKADITVRFSR